MVHVSGNPQWQDYPSLATLITASALENLENALDNSDAGTVLATTQAAADAAAQSAADADAAVLLAQQAQAASLEVPDDNVSALVGNPVTLTRAALDDTYQTAVLVTSQPGATDRDKLISALQAATAQGGTVHLPDGRIDVGAGLSLAGYSCGIIGHGAGRGSGEAKSTIFASTQTGPVLDFTGFNWPPGYRGRIRFGGFTVEGSGIADPTKANKGIWLPAYAGPGAVTWRDIMVWKTGGECIAGERIYLQNFESINLVSPFGARENDVPYMRLTASNGNNLDVSFYQESNGVDAATVGAGVSGALVIESDDVYLSTKNHIDARTENIRIPSGGTMLNICGSLNVVNNRDFDSKQDVGATNTSFIRLAADPRGVARGGNMVVGEIHGYNTTTTRTVTWGVDIQENGSSIVGVKGYRGGNVRLAPGVERVYAVLGGAVSNATDEAFVNESAARNNTLIDHTVGSQQWMGVRLTPESDLSSDFLRVQMQNWDNRGGFRLGDGNVELRSQGNSALLSGDSVSLGLGSSVPERVEVRGKQTYFPAVTALPIAGAANHRSVVLLSVSGSDDQMMMCLRRADGTYYWKEL